jgi:hypothetical protein
MDGELALAMVQRCASVLCLDVPEGTDVGLDTELWVVGPRFKGIKMIPPGQAHFFYYRCGLPPPPPLHLPFPHCGMPSGAGGCCAWNDSRSLWCCPAVRVTTVAWVAGRLRAVVAASSTCRQQRYCSKAALSSTALYMPRVWSDRVLARLGC